MAKNSLVAVCMGIFRRCIDFIACPSSFEPGDEVVDEHRGGDDDDNAHHH
jgi:hypothetical protein